MSWEDMGSRKYKCPCGSGTYTIILFMDDWNRSKENWGMDCPTCKQNYRIYTYSYSDSGKTWSASLWTKEEQYENVKRIEAQLANAKKDIVDTAASRYMDKWLLYFQNAKTKKEIWRRLTDNGKRYPRLSTFYTHLSHEDSAAYLRREFHYDNVQTILRKLGVIDIEINGIFQTAKDLVELPPLNRTLA